MGGAVVALSDAAEAAAASNSYRFGGFNGSGVLFSTVYVNTAQLTPCGSYKLKLRALRAFSGTLSKA